MLFTLPTQRVNINHYSFFLFFSLPRSSFGKKKELVSGVLNDFVDLILYFKVHACVPANTFAIYGNGEEKGLTELVPGILNQLGPDSLASLRKLAESYQSMQKKDEDDKKDDDDDEDIPDLVGEENFELKTE